MTTKHFSSNKSGGVTTTNLTAVTSSTNGLRIEMRDFTYKTVFIEVTGNTGTVTVNVEGSHDGITWFVLNNTTYTATNANEVRSYSDHFPFMRTSTTNHTDATVTTDITGGN